MPKLIIDFRMRKIEKDYLRELGYELIENNFNLNTYDEISSHPDIYYLRINNNLFCSADKKNYIPKAVTCISEIGMKYPNDVPFNVCIVGKNALHNFKYTDSIVKIYLEKNEYNLINVEQGYTKCSTVVLDNNSCITSDIGIARALIDNNIDVLYVNEPDIKLLRRTNKMFKEQNQMSFCNSDMQGFIGGACTVLNDTFIVFGDIDKLINSKKIKKFVEKKGLKLHYFKDLDIIDYGGVIEVI